MIQMFIFVVAVFLNSYAFSQENVRFEQTLNFLKAEAGLLAGNGEDMHLSGVGEPKITRNPQLDFYGYISSWRQSCAEGGAEGCALPVGVEQNKPVNFKLNLPVSPGEAGIAKFSREFHFRTDSGMDRIEVDFIIYSICPASGGTAASDIGDRMADCPRSAGPDGEEPCPLRYFQTQIEIKGEAQAFCGASINRNDAFPFPVLMCAGVSRNDASQRLGVSLHRIPLK